MKKVLMILLVILSFNSFSDIAVITDNKEIGDFFKEKVNDVEVINLQNEKNIKNETDKIDENEIKELIELLKKELNEISKIKLNQKSINNFLEGMKYLYDDEEKAKNLFLKSIKEDKNNYLSYFYLGYYEQDLKGNMEKAVEYYKQSIKINPEYPMSYNNLSDSYRLIGNDNEANKIIEQLISLFPDFPETYYQAGIKYMQEENFSKAIETFEIAIKKYKNLPNTKFYTYLTPDLKEEYIMDCETHIIISYLYIENFPKALSYFTQVYSKMKQNDYKNIVNIIDSLVEYNETVIKFENINQYKQNMKKIEKLLNSK